MLKFLTKTSVFLALIFAIFLGTTMSVKASNLFEVKNVSVDAEASSALEARGIALKNGQTRAFQVLLKRLTRVEDWPVLPIVNEQEIETFVRRFRLQDEKTSTRRYLASMSVVFEPETCWIYYVISIFRFPRHRRARCCYCLYWKMLMVIAFGTITGGPKVGHEWI